MTKHVPILLDPIVETLSEPFFGKTETAWLLDCTLGGGGHAAALLKAIEPHRVIAIDQDLGAVERGRERFAEEVRWGRMEIHHAKISEAAPLLAGKRVLGMMADLGFSSDQIDDPERGLSFRHEGPLDMRLDTSRGRSARELLQQASEREIAKLLEEYGEERFARRIAGAIILSRREQGVPKTTKELSELIVRAIPAGARHGKIHAATRTFQALRIAVNDELNELDCLLKRVILELQPGGRVAILSFHSLEDRRVKQAFREPPLRQLGKKPIEASEEEVRENPRARSAKLRIAERTE
jgi:16S rRNA (cytosine1402-N4)-methyltransferase